MVAKKKDMSPSEKKGFRQGLSLRNLFEGLTTNVSLMRSDLVRQLFDPRRNIDKEAGYPDNITREMYRKMYDREGVAKRIVHFWPEESWSLDPVIFETEDPKMTAWEEALDGLLKEHNIFHYLERLDIMSGIGRFGVLLLGINDGLELKEPIEGVGDDGKAIGSPPERELLYLRVLSEDAVDVSTWESNNQSPRYGKPVLYNVMLTEYDGTTGGVSSERTEAIHWTRIIHCADNLQMSDTLGDSRMLVVWNRLLDHQKVMGGSGEMFWKGAFPGLSVETLPDMPDVDLDEVSLRGQLSNYFNGLQRYLALTGVTVKSLSPQLASPKDHREVIMEDIAFSMNVPKRKLFGSEQAQLASSQDARTWNGRVKRRNEKHVTPCIVRPFIDRCMAVGLLPIIEEYEVEWPDLNTQTDQEKAEVGGKRTESLAKYVQAGCEAIIAPEDFFTLIMEMDPAEVEQIKKGLDEFETLLDLRKEQEAEAAAKAAALVPPPEAGADEDESGN